jgi:hypothetical protein
MIKMIKEINITDLYYGYKECIEQHLENINTDPYLQQMVKDINKLPPVSVIDIGFYSLSNGYHRLAVHLYLGLKTIKIEVN